MARLRAALRGGTSQASGDGGGSKAASATSAASDNGSDGDSSVQATETYKTQWAKHLSGRSGWHGLHTRTSNIMVMLMNIGCVTYYIDLEPNRVSGELLTYALTRNFDLESQLHPLVELDAIHADSEVLGAFNFGVEAKATADGDGARVIVWAKRGLRITAPLRKRERGTDTAHGEELAEDEEDEHNIEDAIGLIIQGRRI